MGVKWLLRWRGQSGGGGDETGRTGSAEEDMLMSIVDLMGCKLVRDAKNVKMEVKCHLLRQPIAGQQTMKDVWLVQSSDATSTCFLVDRNAHAVMEADNGMLTLVEKKLQYAIKQCVTFTGKRYTKGDFELRVASASSSVVGSAGSHTFLGHFIELEYLPLSCPVTAAGMLSAFVDLMRAVTPTTPMGMPLGSFERPRDNTGRYQHLSPTFSHQHCSVLYVDLCMALLVSRTQQQQQQQQPQQQRP